MWNTTTIIRNSTLISTESTLFLNVSRITSVAYLYILNNSRHCVPPCGHIFCLHAAPSQHASDAEPKKQHIQNKHATRYAPRNNRKCWLESSFVGNRPLDSPQTPTTATLDQSTAAAAATTTTTHSTFTSHRRASENPMKTSGGKSAVYV